MIYHRTDLAERMATQLLSPGVLDEHLRSGLFISGLRRTGKTTFLLADLVPTLEQKGAVVIYVDLWTDTLTSPATLLHQAITDKLKELESPGSRSLKLLDRVHGLELGALGVKFGFKFQELGKPGGTTLAQALKEVVDRAKAHVVLIIDEVQQATASEEGQNMLLALKAARDAINPRPGTPGYMVFIGTGSHRAQLSEMTAKRNQAFAGANSIQFPVLGEGYVDFLLSRYEAEVSAGKLPSRVIALDAFRALGNRPEELKKALGHVIRQGGDPNMVMPIVAQTLRSAIADAEILKVGTLGSLALEIFAKIATSTEPVKGLFAADAVADYSKAIGREVRTDEIQPILNAMVSENLVMRRGHGMYTLADPYVGEIWEDSQRLMNAADTPGDASRDR